MKNIPFSIKITLNYIDFKDFIDEETLISEYDGDNLEEKLTNYLKEFVEFEPYELLFCADEDKNGSFFDKMEVKIIEGK